MSAMAAPISPKLLGHAKPRLAPPLPARSQWREFRDLAKELGITLYPWQETAARYLTALGPEDRWLYPEIAIIVGRQNGKTELLKPTIIRRLLNGERVMHTAQNAKLPRDIHEEIATLLLEHYPERLPKRRAISYAVGHEEIKVTGGGHYRIVAPTKGGARGPSNDLVIIDELREMDSHEFIAAAEPTLSSAPNPQIIYLSNAGTDESDVLNGLKLRSDQDPALAYLEWSALPDRDASDLAGWLEANPAVGHMPGKLEYLQRKLNSYRMENQLAIFETEHLCRWVQTMRERLLDENAWLACAADGELTPNKPFMGIASSPDGSRASVALAWQQADGSIGLTMAIEGTGNPIHTPDLGREMRELANRLGVPEVGYDPLTDGELAKYFRKATPISGQKFANASARFVTAVNAGSLRHAESATVTADLAWTAKKAHDESGSYQAVRANDDRPITAVLAAIRAVWMASGPAKPRVARIY